MEGDERRTRTAAGNETPMAVRRRDFVAREIERAAIELFLESGYDNVSVLEISAAAGVSRRTFFRHFTSKADVLRARDARLSVRLVVAFERRPPDEHPAVALCNAFVDVSRMQPADEPGALLASRFSLEVARTAFSTAAAEFTDELSSLVARRLDTDPSNDPRPDVIVLTIVAASRAATKHWTLADGDKPLAVYLEECFRHVLGGLEGL